jgi:malic enzyme
MSDSSRQSGYRPEYIALAGPHLSKVDDRIRKLDLELESLIRDAEMLDAEPSVPNHKRITELVLLLAQLRDNSDRVNAFLMRSIQRYVPTISEQGLADIKAGLNNLERILSSEYNGMPFVEFVKRYLETIDYPGYSHVERGISELREMEDYKIAYTPGVAQMCLLVQALHTHASLLANISFMDLRGLMRKVVHVVQDRVTEAIRSLTGSTGSIHIPRLSLGTQWRNPATREWETHPVLLGARAYIESLPAPLCLVVTDQTAVLGLEDIGPLGGHPVMVGKGKINASAGRFTALPVSIDSTNDDAIVEITEFLSRSRGVQAINLEDITGKGGRCFRIQRELQRRLPIPIFHDDQDGTAIITLAGLLTALQDQGKQLEEVKIVMSGAGAAGIKIARFLLAAGARGDKIVMLDSRGVLSTARPDLVDDPERNPRHRSQLEKIELLGEICNQHHGGFARAAVEQREPPPRNEVLTADRTEVMRGADVFIGMSIANIISEKMVQSMADRPIVFACANPNPEISYEAAIRSREDLIFGSGSSLYPNQINNAVAFPGLLAGLMFSGARVLDIEAGVAAARAIADRTAEIRREDPVCDEVVPKVIDGPLHREVAQATLQDVFARGLNHDPEGQEPTPDQARCTERLKRRFETS